MSNDGGTHLKEIERILNSYLFEKCSKCGKKDITVKKHMFGGKCTHCVDKELL